ncbi:MAG TPA: cysteine desulfurase [candidate division Zixibacteria bacterium]|mgnify:FL=1|nr:cysteine desulfurase [candidate division Zixibacteria bacterium]MDD4918094.1 cysteine desulfurase [candidate division Zixibacteria bacterium]MDM7972037.1 cysteine desulfurase [candidate division Zixibacteria bacterium]HOD66832.1 cysteine desulfurase [candidate division Zixibacteria bacterium]HPM37388.1 cysteine desulfurase [candidate division Zixibacteria bacterium]
MKPHAAAPSAAPLTALDIERLRADFPILHTTVRGRRLVYLDNAATTQKPNAVIEAESDYYRTSNANIHRGLHHLSERSTELYERTRQHTARFIGGVDPQEIIFTRGTTESINLVAYTWGEENLREGDEIVITQMEHHANLVPWVELARRKRAVLRQIPIQPNGTLDLASLDRLITPRTRLTAVCHMSNVLGTINPVSAIAAAAKRYGAVVLADGAQAAPHLPVRIGELGVDFYAFSAHKMLGPTGVGVLWGRRALLEAMPPFITGGEMIREVSLDRVTWADLPNKFEGGTPNIAGVIAFDAALSYLEALGMDRVRRHEEDLTRYALDRLQTLAGLEIQGPTDPARRGGAISFTDPDLHPHDISTFLDSRGIAIRAGHHCAQPLMRLLGKIATARASFYIYNDEADVDALVDALLEMRRYFGL